MSPCVVSCHCSAGREAGSTAVLAAKRQNGSDWRPRTTTHDRARPHTTTHDHARPRTTAAHDRARPTTAAIFVWGSGTYPTPGGFRSLNCLARLARERTPSLNIIERPTPRTADVTVTKIAGYVRVGILMNRWFFRIFGIHCFSITAHLLNIWICMRLADFAHM